MTKPRLFIILFVVSSILENFIVLEGLDGSGTTTQLKLLDARLSREDIPHDTTFEPTDGPIGNLIRSILSHHTRAHPFTIAMLYAADRNEHLNSQDGVIAKASRGLRVVSDRYLFSSLAYQSVQCGMEYVRALNSVFPLPRFLFFIDTPVEVCQRRLSGRGEAELFDGFEFQAKVRSAYLETIRGFMDSGMTISVLEGDRAAETIHEDIWRILAGRR
jgi:dTMP kinase